MISWASRAVLSYSSVLMWRLAITELAGHSHRGLTDDGEKATLLLSERVEKRPFEMSDIIWHYYYLMGGTSASSVREIRTSTAGAVCLHLNSQLLLLHAPLATDSA